MNKMMIDVRSNEVNFLEHCIRLRYHVMGEELTIPKQE
jgi:hypothetical protein